MEGLPVLTPEPPEAPQTEGSRSPRKPRLIAFSSEGIVFAAPFRQEARSPGRLARSPSRHARSPSPRRRPAASARPHTVPLPRAAGTSAAEGREGARPRTAEGAGPAPADAAGPRPASSPSGGPGRPRAVGPGGGAAEAPGGCLASRALAAEEGAAAEPRRLLVPAASGAAALSARSVPPLRSVHGTGGRSASLGTSGAAARSARRSEARPRRPVSDAAGPAPSWSLQYCKLSEVSSTSAASALYASAPCQPAPPPRPPSPMIPILKKFSEADKPAGAAAGKVNRQVGGVRSKLRRCVAVAVMFRAKPAWMKQLSLSVDDDPQLLVSNTLSKKQLEVIRNNTNMAEDIDAIYRLFKHFDFDDVGTIRTEDAPEVLSDLGVKPTSPEELRWVHELIEEQQVAVPGACSFEELLSLLIVAREEFRTWRWNESMRLFEAAGGITNGRVSRRQLKRVLKESVVLAPQDKMEEGEVQKVLDSFPQRDAIGLSFHEFEECLSRLRLVLSLKRSEDQLSRGKALSLNPAIATEFRWDLKAFIKIFRRYVAQDQEELDEDCPPDEDVVAPQHVRALLIDTGVLGWHFIRHWSIESILPNCKCNIMMVLGIIRNIRSAVMDDIQDELIERFNHYARNNRSLQLHKRDIYGILSDFKMTPTTRYEQIKVATVIERFDADCTGTFELDEFKAFYLSLLEQNRLLAREKEYRVARRLKMRPRQIAKLRATFVGLDPDPEGCVPHMAVADVFHGVHIELTGRVGRSPKLVQHIRSSPEKRVSFLELTKLVHLSITDAQRYHSLGQFGESRCGWTEEELMCGETEDDAEEEDGDGLSHDSDSTQEGTFQTKFAREDSLFTATTLDAEFRTWIWDEVMCARRCFSESQLQRFDTAHEQGAQGVWLQDEEAWNGLRARLVEQLSSTLETSKVTRVVPAKCHMALPILLVPLTSSTPPQCADLRSDYAMQLLGVEFGRRRGQVQPVIGEPPKVVPGDRLWVGFEGGVVQREHLEKLTGSDDLDWMQWSMLPLFHVLTPPEMHGMTLRECNFEHLFGAIVCGLKHQGGLEAFPGDHWKLDASTVSLLVHIVSPVKFFTSMCALSSGTTASRISMHINRGTILAAATLADGSAQEAPLGQTSPARWRSVASVSPSAVDGELSPPVSSRRRRRRTSVAPSAMDGELSPQRSSRTKSLTLSAVDGELSPLASSRRSAAPSAVDGGVRSPQASSGRNPVAPSGAECERSQVVSPKKAAHGVAGGERSEALSPKKSVAFSEPRGPRQ